MTAHHFSDCGNNVFYCAMTPSTAGVRTSIFSVINMAAIASKLGITPLYPCYAYYSTDHAGPDSDRVWAADGNTLLGPFTGINGPLAGGRVYVDTFAGEQTETPVVRYDDATNRLLIMYQQELIPGGNGQESVMAASSNGITDWTRIGIATTIDKSDMSLTMMATPASSKIRSVSYRVGQLFGACPMARMAVAGVWRTAMMA
ncbi:MAG: hypothetical protein EOP02_03360 [Proteobacteria bacterium]|nr:MAG: hypothetical protein EOP02_03360 [Pseudomonadota bacterium]